MGQTFTKYICKMYLNYKNPSFPHGNQYSISDSDLIKYVNCIAALSSPYHI